MNLKKYQINALVDTVSESLLKKIKDINDKISNACMIDMEVAKKDLEKNDENIINAREMLRLERQKDTLSKKIKILKEKSIISLDYYPLQYGEDYINSYINNKISDKFLLSTEINRRDIENYIITSDLKKNGKLDIDSIIETLFNQIKHK